MEVSVNQNVKYVSGVGNHYLVNKDNWSHGGGGQKINSSEVWLRATGRWLKNL
jgi:hypothetical protein